jgi:hypothetical protein
VPSGSEHNYYSEKPAFEKPSIVNSIRSENRGKQPVKKVPHKKNKKKARDDEYMEEEDFVENYDEPE